MNRILKAYLKRLTNLSTRNKSLLLTSLAVEQFIDLHETDFLLGKSSFEIVGQLIQRKSRIALCEVADPRYEKVNEASKRLRKIARTEKFIEEERGSQDLYVGYPFVKGKLSDGTPIHAPLLFFPVTLKIDKEQWCLFERDEMNIALNQSFALAYAHFNEAKVSDEVLEKSFEDFPRDFLEFRTQLYEWLKTTPFRINFNQELFEDRLSAFQPIKSAELIENEHNGELKLFPEAVLGIFPQAGSYLVPDYNTLIDQFEQQPFQIPLIGDEEFEPEDGGELVEEGTSITFKNRNIKEEEVLTPFPIDESQEEIILAVKSGRSAVVQGPPGSGKSQLICNLMADFAARGKRVLLVCQKRAALDVVYQRLQTIGMNDFVGLIHDFKNDRSGLFRQIASQIDKVEAYRQQNYSLDAVFLERQFTQESRAIDRTVTELNSFRQALFDETECGVSIKELYLTSDPEKPNVDLKEHYKHFRPDSWDHFRRRFRTYVDYALLITDHPWAKRKSFAGLGIGDLRAMENMLFEWPQVFFQQKQTFESLTGESFSPIFIEKRNEIIERLTDICGLIPEPVIWKLFQNYIGSASNMHERLAFIRQTTDTLEGFIEEGGVEFSLDRAQLSAFAQSLKKAIDAKKSAVTGLWWDMFGKEKREVEKVAAENGLTLSVDDLAKLEIRLRNRLELENWLRNPSLSFDSDYLDDNNLNAGQHLEFFRWAEAAADAVVRANIEPWFGIIQKIQSEKPDLNEFLKTIAALKKWLEVWNRLESAMQPFLLPEQIKNLVREPEMYSALLLESLRKDFDSLVDMDRLWAEMSLAEHAVTRLVIDEARRQGIVQVAGIIHLFENSIKLAWIAHVETESPQLRSVTSLKMRQWEEQLQESITQKQKLSSEITNIKLREGTYEDVEKNRLGNRVTYRELGHQVTKKRKIWPIRKLLESYSDEVFSLIPCWMASPEAVSAIFPMQAALFDLVIFDEASQCYAEYGLPAAFRGRQVVVTGDNKQLSPSDLYKVRYEDRAEEEEYSAAIEIESLLDLAAQSLDQYQLTGHYRSLSLDLIDFSNRNFYKNTLKLLPDFKRINGEQPGIQFIKTDGIWKNNVNLVEVKKVTELVRELGSENKTIGVVTFNFFQQQAIQDNLEKEAISAKGLFVKNIENVQGDERDIIIFSMAYAPDEKGRIAMQFGTLNMQGGENRLNVAVTRARERIYFVTSLWPSQLQTEQLANAGPKMLKGYLEYALEVSEGRFQPMPLSIKQFRSDWLLKERLLKMQPDFEKELPFGDITVKEEGVYKGLILTDDDLYHHSKSSKEPHAYLPLLLRLKNWPFRRVYSREYWSKVLDDRIL